MIAGLNCQTGYTTEVNRCKVQVYVPKSKFSWLIAYMSQLNPIIGPTLKEDTYNAIKAEW